MGDWGYGVDMKGMDIILDDTLALTADDWGAISAHDWTAADVPKLNPGTPVIEVTTEKAQDALLRFRGKDVTLLNFASGVSPGGGVRYGAMAQEEDLCLCSGLLHGLETLPGFFLANYAKDAPPECYDVMLVSEKVPFVKNGSYQEVEPFRVRVFSYSAPNNWRSGITPEVAGNTFARRAHQIVHRAAELGTEVLILGAWGCGEYANEPEMVAKAFKTAIARLSGGIETVVFPIWGKETNFNTFQEVLGW